MANIFHEIWAPVIGYEGYYEVSAFGNIKRIKGFWCQRDRMKKPFMSNTGYLRVNMCRDGTHNAIKKTVHSIVAESFIGPRPYGFNVHHKDGDKLNNRADNLEYVSASDNQLHAYKIGLQYAQKGSKRPNAKLHESDIPAIRDLLREGVSKRKIAMKFGVTDMVIVGIARGARWKHV